jgi:hypothetical protein
LFVDFVDIGTRSEIQSSVLRISAGLTGCWSYLYLVLDWIITYCFKDRILSCLRSELESGSAYWIQLWLPGRKQILNGSIHGGGTATSAQKTQNGFKRILQVLVCFLGI